MPSVILQDASIALTSPQTGETGYWGNRVMLLNALTKSELEHFLWKGYPQPYFKFVIQDAGAQHDGGAFERWVLGAPALLHLDYVPMGILGNQGGSMYTPISIGSGNKPKIFALGLPMSYELSDAEQAFRRLMVYKPWQV